MNKHQIKNKTLEERLGNNELKEYLAHKEETGLVVPSLSKGEELVSYYHQVKGDLKALLIAPPITIPRNMQKRCIPPLGLSYIAASLEKAGHKVEMLDCTVEGYENEEINGNLMTYGLSVKTLEEKLRKSTAPDIVGMSVLFSTDLPNLFKVSRIVRQVFPNVIIVVGGLHPTIYPKDVFDMDLKLNGKVRTIDWIIRGEGEIRFMDFVRHLKQGKVNLNSDGLVGYYKERFIYNHQISVICDLDSLSFPAYHLLPMEKYFQINVPFSPVPAGNRVMQILASRGCPIGCSFCANTNMYRNYRYRSVKNIMQEILYYKEKYHIDEIQFADDNLTFNRQHSLDLFKALKEAKLKWCTPNGVMINTITPELIDVMAESGLYQITLSLDSGSVRTLKELHHKPVNLNSIPGIIKRAREHKIFTHGTVVVGMPGETIDDIKESFDYIKTNLPLTSISMFIAAPIPGSELYHNALEQGLITKDEACLIDTTKCKLHYSDINPVVLEKMVMDFQQEFTELAKRRDPQEYERKYNRLIKAGRLQGAYGGRLT